MCLQLLSTWIAALFPDIKDDQIILVATSCLLLLDDSIDLTLEQMLCILLLSELLLLMLLIWAKKILAVLRRLLVMLFSVTDTELLLLEKWDLRPNQMLLLMLILRLLIVLLILVDDVRRFEDSKSLVTRYVGRLRWLLHDRYATDLLWGEGGCRHRWGCVWRRSLLAQLVMQLLAGRVGLARVGKRVRTSCRGTVVAPSVLVSWVIIRWGCQ